MIPKLKRVSQHTFDRIGDHYSSYIDREHFLGRSALDDHWTKSDSIPVQVNYSPEGCMIRVSLPGFKKEEIHLHFEENALYLRASSKRKAKGSSPKSVNRVFSIPQHTKKKAISAEFKKGVVEITLPKKTLPDSMEIQLN